MTPSPATLDVLLHGHPIATMTLLPGDRTVFAFQEAYIDDPVRPTLSLSFKDRLGELITTLRPTQTVLPPFFSNLLPEGPLRDLLARQAGINPAREFMLLARLGLDLPGAVTVRPAEGQAALDPPERLPPEAGARADTTAMLRFSLAGVQLKFSAIKAERNNGLTIPATGTGGSWIVKLPSNRFAGVPENEFAMMSLARRLGMDVPDVLLVDLRDIDGLPSGIGTLTGPALAIRRFDRTEAGPVHMEDFAQVFGVFPQQKYEKASYRSIAAVIGTEVGDVGTAEFIRRLVFNTLIGNADMHLKNWSLVYPDHRAPCLAPSYDVLSTVAYLDDRDAALNYVRTRRMADVTYGLLASLASKAALPEALVLDTARATVDAFLTLWQAEKTHLALPRETIAAIDHHIETLQLIRS